MIRPLAGAISRPLPNALGCPKNTARASLDAMFEKPGTRQPEKPSLAVLIHQTGFLVAGGDSGFWGAL